MENVMDISTLEVRSRQFVDVFKALFRSYVKLNKGMEAIVSLEQFRALVLKHRMQQRDDELLLDNIEEKLMNPLF